MRSGSIWYTTEGGYRETVVAPRTRMIEEARVAAQLLLTEKPLPAGFCALPGAMPMQDHTQEPPSDSRPIRTRKRRIAAHAMRIYAWLRSDFPPQQMGRPTAGLRDFMGNMGRCLQRLPPDQLVAVLETADARHRLAIERHAYRVTGIKIPSTDDLAKEVNRLEKRKAYKDGIRRLDSLLASELPHQLTVVANLEEHLLCRGYSEKEAIKFSEAWARVPVPRG